MTAIQSRAGRTLRSLSGFFDRHAGLVLLVLVLLYLPAAFDASRAKPLWHDELYTFYTAQAPTLRAMWHDLSIYDLNPPLIYYLTRLSFHLLGVNTLAARLPEILAFLVALLCLFQFVLRRLGVLFAAFAVMVVLESDIFQLAVEARPYALTFAFTGLALIAWQNLTASAAKARSATLALLAVSLACLLLSHIFGLAALGALFAAELDRSRHRRRVDWPIVSAMLLPLAVGVLYLPMLQNHASALYPAAFQPDGDAIFAFYIHLIDRVLIALSLTALAVRLLLGVSHLRGAAGAPTRSWFFATQEWTFLFLLMAVPLALMAYLAIRGGAFFPRYGSIATFAVAILATALLARWTLDDARPDPRAALLGSFILFFMSGLFTILPHQLATGTLIPTVANSEPHPEPCQACQRAAAIDPSLPLVDASGLTFIEMNHREPPATLARLYYLTDPAGSLQFAHANIFERMPQVVDRFHLRGHTQPYAQFLAGHPHFFVFGRYDYPEDWLLRKLTADGARIQITARTADSYRDTELYEVWLTPSR